VVCGKSAYQTPTATNGSGVARQTTSSASPRSDVRLSSGATGTAEQIPSQGQSPQSFTFDAAGRAYIRFGINEPDRSYEIKVTATRGGVNSNASATIHVGPASENGTRRCPGS
jgi:hypothetical protein